MITQEISWGVLIALYAILILMCDQYLRYDGFFRTHQLGMIMSGATLGFIILWLVFFFGRVF